MKRPVPPSAHPPAAAHTAQASTAFTALAECQTQRSRPSGIPIDVPESSHRLNLCLSGSSTPHVPSLEDKTFLCL
jgi:hypothetical protein